MRRRLTTLGTTTSIMLLAAVMAAGPAEARRNLGGSEPGADICVLPGNAGIQSNQAGLGAVCICVLAPEDQVLRNVGIDPNAACPVGVTRRQ